ncbi:MAG TPA: hypothetical protein VKV18_03800 [Chthonomonas sp.]|uniref:hypothetical protein n=1 Tax=Chthonomonas sp. TaxID=2282153 RepID=UPI002B4B864F|nr:hypothetical protein [Chthonomonas sp.]HLI47801.1 hypothetical protein [Chthonomonas sp.]
MKPKTEKSYLAQRRARARRAFWLRVVLLVLLMLGVAYAAWFSPHALHPQPARIVLQP